MGEAYEDQGLVFCQPNGQPIDPRNFTRSFERLLTQAGLPKIRFERTRNEFRGKVVRDNGFWVQGTLRPW